MNKNLRTHGLCDKGGQAYDGAANMSGRLSGAQAELRQEPLAWYELWVTNILENQGHIFSSSSTFRGTVDITQTSVPNQVDSARKSCQSSAVSV